MITDYRIERKFTLGINNSDFFKKILVTSCFHKPHIDRDVSSVYLDTYDYNFFKDNIFNQLSGFFSKIFIYLKKQKSILR